MEFHFWRFCKKSVPNFHFTEFPFLNEILSKSDPQFPFSVKRSIREKSKNIWEQFVAIWSLHFSIFENSNFHYFEFSNIHFRCFESCCQQRKETIRESFKVKQLSIFQRVLPILLKFPFYRISIFGVGFVTFRANFHFIEFPFHRESTVYSWT